MWRFSSTIRLRAQGKTSLTNTIRLFPIFVAAQHKNVPGRIDQDPQISIVGSDPDLDPHVRCNGDLRSGCGAGAALQAVSE